MAFRKVATDDCQPGQPESVDSALSIAQDKDRRVDADMLCDTQFHIERRATTAVDDSICCVHSECFIDLCNEFPGNVSE